MNEQMEHYRDLKSNFSNDEVPCLQHPAIVNL